MPVEHDEKGRFAASAGAAAEKAGGVADKRTAKAGKKSESTNDRVAAHKSAADGHAIAALRYGEAAAAHQKAAAEVAQHAGTVGYVEAARGFQHAADLAKKGDEYTAKAAEHSAKSAEHVAAANNLKDRPARQAAFIKSELESKSPGTKVTVGELSSGGGHHVVVEHEPSGSKRTMGVSKYGVTGGEVNYGSATMHHPTNGTMVESGRGKFEKTLQATLNKAKKLDMGEYLPSAKKCLDRIACNKLVTLDAADRAGMIRELTAAGVMIDVRNGDAYVAVRYDAEFNEGDHPRDEHGRFGAGASADKAAKSANAAQTSARKASVSTSSRMAEKHAAKAGEHARAARASATEATKAAGNDPKEIPHGGRAIVAAERAEASASRAREVAQGLRASEAREAAKAATPTATAKPSFKERVAAARATNAAAAQNPSPAAIAAAAKSGEAQASRNYSANAWNHTEQGPTVGYYRNGTVGTAEARTTFSSMAEAEAHAAAYNKKAESFSKK